MFKRRVGAEMGIVMQSEAGEQRAKRR